MFDKTVTVPFAFQIDDPRIIAMDVRYISGKRWLTREYKETLAKAADQMEKLLEYYDYWVKVGEAMREAWENIIEMNRFQEDHNIKIFKDEGDN